MSLEEHNSLLCLAERKLAAEALYLLSVGQSQEERALGRGRTEDQVGKSDPTQPASSGGRLFLIDMGARSELRGQHQVLSYGQKPWRSQDLLGYKTGKGCCELEGTDSLLNCAITPVYIVFNHPGDLRLMKTPRQHRKPVQQSWAHLTVHCHTGGLLPWDTSIAIF